MELWSGGVLECWNRGVMECWSRGVMGLMRPGRYSTLVLILTTLHLSTTPVLHAVSPIAVEIPTPKAYVGQRLPFFVKVRATGSFGGATNFSLPEVPGTVIVKVGNPVVESEQLEGESWFVQTHEFAIFSQKDGPVEIPAFPVQYGTRDGFTGPVTEQEGTVPAFSITIERPAGTDPGRFLVTTDSLTIDERWNPQPDGEFKTGAVFKRTISQSADNLTGMALAPSPINAPEGIKVYRGEANVSDNTERGAFSGERTETLTYLVERPGVYTLPAIRYDWWNPNSQQLESKTLPAVSFTATASPEAAVKQTVGTRWLTPLLCIGILLTLAAAGWLFRKPIGNRLLRLRDRIDPPDHRAARAFLGACRGNDAVAADQAWAAWVRLQASPQPASADLQAQLIDLHRHLYGPDPDPKFWNGAALAKAFSEHSRGAPPSRIATSLPPLNPTALDLSTRDR